MPVFSNEIEPGNEPDTSSLSGELKIEHQEADKPTSTPWAGDDERPIQDNGTGGHNSYVVGQPSGNSFPPVYNETGDDEATNILDYGLNEGVEVGHDGSVADYGVVGPAAGGHVRKNTIE